MSPLTEKEPLWEKIAWVVLEVALGLILITAGTFLVSIADTGWVLAAFAVITGCGWIMFIAGVVNAVRTWKERPRRPFRPSVKYSGLREPR